MTKVHVVFNGLVRQFILYFTFINKYMFADIEKNVSQNIN